ncbi:MAG: FG-GAP-like repeat-containing protein, partial [Sandaracinaceae bacterium]
VGGCSDDDDDNGNGVPDCLDAGIDLCPSDPSKTTPGTCGCGIDDDDVNGNGVPDCLDASIDLCPSDDNKVVPGTCGCGISDDDADDNGVPDCLDAGIDLCPDDTTKTVPGTCGCGMSDDDSNANGVPDCLDAGIDLCPADASKTVPGTCGCGASDVDLNTNGVPDCLDAGIDFCPADPGKTLPGTCGCGTSDADTNMNGAPDCLDAGLSCPMGLADCSGACVDTGTNPAHCGGCASPCPTAVGVTAVCIASTCGSVCAPGTLDCNGDPSDGCEVDATSDDNCGGCGNVCPASQACVSGSCAPCTLEWSSAVHFTGLPDGKSFDVADFDNDGAPDIADGGDASARVYRGSDAGLTLVWTDTLPGGCTTVAWGELSGDGFRDLAIGHCDAASVVVRNNAGTLDSGASWTAPATMHTVDLDWVDWNGDGNEDLTFGNLADFGPSTRVYDNTGTTLASTPSFTAGASEHAGLVAWGDMDGDGDPDMARVGTSSGAFMGGLYVERNDDVALTNVLSDTSRASEVARFVEWADVNGDGRQDLFYGTDTRIELYLSDAGVPDSSTVSWTAAAGTGAEARDLNEDGFVDLVVTRLGASNEVYLSNGDGTMSSLWTSAETDDSQEVHWLVTEDERLPLLVVRNTNSIRAYEPACN